MAIEIEIVDIDWKSSFIRKFRKYMKNYNLAIAVLLDLLGYVFAQLAYLNTLWDLLTFGLLFFMVRSKKLPYYALLALLLPGIKMLGSMDALLPIATILVLVDSYWYR